MNYEERYPGDIPARFMGQFSKYVGYHPNDTVTMPTAELFKFIEDICDEYWRAGHSEGSDPAY